MHSENLNIWIKNHIYDYIYDLYFMWFIWFHICHFYIWFVYYFIYDLYIIHYIHIYIYMWPCVVTFIVCVVTCANTHWMSSLTFAWTFFGVFEHQVASHRHVSIVVSCSFALSSASSHRFENIVAFYCLKFCRVKPKDMIHFHDKILVYIFKTLTLAISSVLWAKN